MSDITVVSQPVIIETSPQVYTINVSSVGAQGATGSAGQINSVSATTLAAGSSATVVNNGTTTNAQLAFGIPKGDKGDTGTAATIAAGSATGLSAGSAPTVNNSGTSSAAVFNFGIPQGTKGDTGTAATATAGTTTTGAAGTNATVVNSGTTSAAIFDFTIPRGNTGTAATATAGTTTTGAAGTNASVVNSGTSSAAVFDFTIPRGNTGATGQGFTYRNAWVSGTSYAAYDVVTYNGSEYVCILAVSGTTVPSSDSSHWTLTASKGDTGAAATIAVNSTTTGNAGTNATVTNSGTSSAALLDFTIPRGNTGQGYTGRGNYSTSTTYQPYDTVYYNGNTYVCTATTLNNAPNFTAYWNKFAVGLTTQGAYSSSTTYNANDLVSYNGGSYVCFTDGTLNKLPTNSTFWGVIANKGDTGATGPTGPQGTTYFQALTSATTGNNSAVLAPMFPSGSTTLTLAANTSYHFEAFYYLTKALSTAPAQWQVGFNFNNAPTNLYWYATLSSNNLSTGTQTGSGQGSGTTISIGTAGTTAGGALIRVVGHFYGSATTTSLQPTFGQSSAPSLTGTPTMNAGSYFRVEPLSTSYPIATGTWSA
jgi:hypothetical protein